MNEDLFGRLYSEARWLSDECGVPVGEVGWVDGSTVEETGVVYRG